MYPFGTTYNIPFLTLHCRVRKGGNGNKEKRLEEKKERVQVEELLEVLVDVVEAEHSKQGYAPVSDLHRVYSEADLRGEYNFNNHTKEPFKVSARNALSIQHDELLYHIQECSI